MLFPTTFVCKFCKFSFCTTFSLGQTVLQNIFSQIEVDNHFAIVASHLSNHIFFAKCPSGQFFAIFVVDRFLQMLQNFVLDNIFATSRVPEGWSGSMWSGWTRSGRSGWPRWSRQSSWSIWSSWFIKRKKSIKKQSTFGPVGQNWPKSAMHEMRFFRTQVPTNVLQG